MDSNSRVGASSSTTRMWSLMGVYFFKPLPETQAERSWETQISRGFFYRLVSECRLAVIRRKRASVISGWIRGRSFSNGLAKPETVGLVVTGSRSFAPSCPALLDRKSTRLNSSHSQISYAVFCLKKKKINVRLGPARLYAGWTRTQDSGFGYGST